MKSFIKEIILAFSTGFIQKIRHNGLVKAEVINIKGVRYPVDQLLGYSQEKLDDILLRQAQATPEQYQQALHFLDTLR